MASFSNASFSGLNGWKKNTRPISGLRCFEIASADTRAPKPSGGPCDATDVSMRVPACHFKRASDGKEFWASDRQGSQSNWKFSKRIKRIHRMLPSLFREDTFFLLYEVNVPCSWLQENNLIGILIKL